MKWPILHWCHSCVSLWITCWQHTNQFILFKFDRPKGHKNGLPFFCNVPSTQFRSRIPKSFVPCPHSPLVTVPLASVVSHGDKDSFIMSTLRLTWRRKELVQNKAESTLPLHTMTIDRPPPHSAKETTCWPSSATSSYLLFVLSCSTYRLQQWYNHKTEHAYN